jgi:cyclopropane fatty-acyl-phospholipid synthase-like methyltransferase
MINKIRSTVYDAIFGGDIQASTPVMYRKVMESLPRGSTVLDIGIGTGATIERAADIIKDRRITIFGVDLDDAYVEKCQQRIIDTGLSSNISVQKRDILKEGIPCEACDAVLFMESYTVMPEETCKQIIKATREVLHRHGTYIFVHNMVTNKEHTHWRDTTKRALKWVLGVDFGRLVSLAQFDTTIISAGLQIEERRILSRIELGGISMRQYMTVCSLIKL